MTANVGFSFRLIEVDYVADGGFLLIIHIGFRKFWWISWILIFRPTGRVLVPCQWVTLKQDGG